MKPQPRNAMWTGPGIRAGGPGDGAPRGVYAGSRHHGSDAARIPDRARGSSRSGVVAVWQRPRLGPLRRAAPPPAPARAHAGPRRAAERAVARLAGPVASPSRRLVDWHAGNARRRRRARRPPARGTFRRQPDRTRRAAPARGAVSGSAPPVRLRVLPLVRHGPLVPLERCRSHSAARRHRIVDAATSARTTRTMCASSSSMRGGLPTPASAPST